MLTDTHCHLNFPEYDLDREAVLERSRESDIVRILNPGIDLESSSAALNLAGTYPEIYCAVGVHPNSASNWSSILMDNVRLLADNKKVVAIGEIGLDYYRDNTPRDIQIHAFRDQLILAAQLRLPVVIHSRQSVNDLISIVSGWVDELSLKGSELRENPGVFHSFSGNLEEAEHLIDLKFKIGITGPITFRNNDEILKIVRAFDIDHFLIETDAPFLTPHPYRGKRNEPSYVRYIADEIAKVKNLSPDYIAHKTTQNSIKLFNW